MEKTLIKKEQFEKYKIAIKKELSELWNEIVNDEPLIFIIQCVFIVLFFIFMIFVITAPFNFGIDISNPTHTCIIGNGSK